MKSLATGILTFIATFLGPFLVAISGWAIGGFLVKWITHR